MSRILLIIILAIAISQPAFAEIQTVIKTIRQPFGGSQSADDARIAAIAKAKREALEQAGTYVESLTVVKDSQLDKDEILAVTAGVCQSEVLTIKNYHTDDAFGIEVTVKVQADTAVLGDKVKKLLADRTHLDQLSSARKKERELLDRISVLEIENRSLKATPKSKKLLKANFRKASQGLTAVDLYDKASATFETDAGKTIEFLNQAIKIDPQYAPAYKMRGAAYFKAKKIKKALQDISEAIRLAPGDSNSYLMRGSFYFELKDHESAATDWAKAISMGEKGKMIYRLTGDIYQKLGKLEKAIEYHNLDISEYSSDPDIYDTYVERGVAYFMLNKLDLAAKDFIQAIKIDPQNGKAYEKRGLVFVQRYVEFKSKFNKTKSEDYEKIAKMHLFVACYDFNKACKLGKCSALNGFKELCMPN